MSRLLDHTVLAAHDPATGRFDALRLAKTLNFTTKEMASILHRTPRGLLKNPDSQQLQGEMARLVLEKVGEMLAKQANLNCP